MGKKKNLDDVIWGDRAEIRSSQYGGVSVAKIGDYQKPKHNGGGYGERCYHGHPALKLPGTELVIYGGSCLTPAVDDADVYIGFDSGMKFTDRHWPWKKGQEVLFKINDMGAPQNPEELKKLVAWTRRQLERGKKVHCGCIGGHGRTGTFFAALVSTYGEPNAAEYVRTHYCSKAVESHEQMKFLEAHFGVLSVKGSKQGGSSYAPKQKQSVTGQHKPLKQSGIEHVRPIRGKSVWDA